MYCTNSNGSPWSEKQKLLASDGAASDEFGWAVAVYNCTAVVGAHGDDNVKGANAGTGYFVCTSYKY